MKNKIPTLLKTSMLLAGGLLTLTGCKNDKNPTNPENVEMVIKMDEDNAQLTLPEGFGALRIADTLGKVRHIAVNDKGTVYAKLGDAEDDRGILILKDTDGDGRMDDQTAFGNYGGTGIALHDNELYATSNSAVFRYKLGDDGTPQNKEQPDTIVDKLIDRRQHNSKSITFDDSGNLYVNIGAYSNNCQEKDRTKGSEGMMPCPILDSAGGIWQFKADKLKQTYGDGERYATGLRNVVGLDWNENGGNLFVMMHGRDQLYSLFPDIYNEEQSSELPAETMYELKKGDNAGWPYQYYDAEKEKYVQAPEYGGDGEKSGDSTVIDPIMAFPAHMAPNALLFYTGDLFPEKYKNGAFIAFHGSWNRNGEQKGFMVAFVPFANGKPSGKWEVFADGFKGAKTVQSAGDAEHRPTGLAQGPDGSLYVSDDKGGSIYRIIYSKNDIDTNSAQASIE